MVSGSYLSGSPQLIDAQASDGTDGFDVLDPLRARLRDGLPAFGTGVGGFPVEECARLMVGEARAFEGEHLKRVIFAVFGAAAEDAFAQRLKTP